MNVPASAHGSERFLFTSLETSDFSCQNGRCFPYHDMADTESCSTVRELIDAIEHQALLIDVQGKILAANRAFAQSMKHDAARILGVNIFAILPAELRRTWKAGLLNAAETGRPFRFEDERNTRVFENTVYPVSNDGGQHVHFAIVSLDITIKKMADKEKTSLQVQLLQAQKMESIGTLAGGMAHDFNNILMGIQGYISLLLHSLEKTHDMYDKLKCIETQIESGANLTKQLLGFARIGPHAAKPTNLNIFLAEKAKMFHRTNKGVLLHMDFSPDLWAVNIDPHKFEQVLLNLFINAWQAMPEEGEICLETRNALLNDDDLSTMGMSPGRYVQVSLTDTGEGIDPAVLPRIFDPFFTTKQIGRGTGLGLASAYGIVRSHGGLIKARSEKGKGATFIIYLPAVDGLHDEGNKEEGAVLAGEERLLIVEDETQIASVLKEMLEMMGYKVFIAGSGQEAVAVYSEKHEIIDLIILDMIMPGMGGGRTFDLLKEINPQVKVILATGYSNNSEIKKIMSRGCNGFLSKPFKIDELSRTIRTVLDNCGY